MKDICKYSTDGRSIFLELILISSTIGKIVVVTLNIVVWSGFIAIFSYTAREGGPGFVIPIFLITTFLILVPGRYAAWNLWGREYIRFNMTSITYSRSYGIITTKEKTIRINEFNYCYAPSAEYDGEEYGKLRIYDYDENDNPIEIFETGIDISKKNIDGIIDLMNVIYHDTMVKKMEGFSLN